MVSKVKDLNQSNYIVFVVWVSISQVRKDFDFNSGLILESRVILDNFYSNIVSVFMISSFKRLSEASLAELLNYFKSVSQMVLEHDVIVASFVVVAAVAVLQQTSFDLPK